MQWIHICMVFFQFSVLVVKVWGQDVCADRVDVSSCKQYSERRFCDTDSRYYSYMTSNCAKTCEFCEEKREEQCMDDSSRAKSCEGWKSAGYCESDSQYVGFMKKTCKKTCGFCGDTLSIKKKEVKRVSTCKDTDSYANGCSGWKSKGYCEKSSTYFSFMEKNCAETCGLCAKAVTVTKPSCVDSEQYKSSCSSWKARGFCEKGTQYYTFVTKNCPSTCGTCSTGSTQKCGKTRKLSGRVVGGQPAVAHTWPWQVGLWYEGEFFCGGTLISDEWVLTATHCALGKKATLLKAVLGDHLRSKNDGTEQEFTIIKIVLHPDYDIRSQNNDIALLKLGRKVTFNQYILPACLPEASSQVSKDQLCFITGWGRTSANAKHSDVLQQAKMPVVTNDKCNSHNAPVGRTAITTQMICAGYGYETLQSGCQGDSGGPFVCNRDETWEVQGVVSWGSSECIGHEKYTVFARVSRFRSWIDKTMGNS